MRPNFQMNTILAHPGIVVAGRHPVIELSQRTTKPTIIHV